MQAQINLQTTPLAVGQSKPQTPLQAEQSAQVTPQTDDKFALQVQLDALWPAEQRKIYCSLTGQPWGQVSDEYIQQLIDMYSFDEFNKFDDYIRNLWIIAGPAPLWQYKVTENLRRNKERDPVGFLVYMIRYTLQIDKLIDAINTQSHRKMHSQSAVEVTYQARVGQIKLYQLLASLPQDQIALCNELLLTMSGEGKLPNRNQMPSTEFTWYGDTDNLVIFLSQLKKLYHRKQKPSRRNEFHARISRGNLHVEEKTVPEQERMINGMLSAMFATVDATFSKAEKIEAKETLGVASPLAALLQQVEADQLANQHKITREIQNQKELADKLKEIKAKEKEQLATKSPAKIIKRGQKIVINQVK